MRGARQESPATRRPAASPPVDPRVALAQQYLQAAESKLAEEEAAKPGAKRRARAAGRAGVPVPFSLSIEPATYVHVILLAISFTFATLVVTLTYHMLMTNFIVGRIIALPAGVVVAVVLSYMSVCYLGVIESTFTGHTNVDSLQGDWREWFWTLPMTLGMVAAAAGLGWILSLILPVNVWLLIAICLWLLYPVLQLSVLESGSALAPVSLAVWRSLGRHPVAWFVFFAVSFALIDALWFLGRVVWYDPPYLTILIMGPIVTVALFVYAWLLGQLANLISTGEKR